MVGLSQDIFLHLAHAVAGQFSHDDQPLGQLETGEPRFQRVKHGGGLQRGPWPAHQDSGNTFAEILVRQADDGAFHHIRHGIDLALHLLGVNIIAAGDDEILAAPDDMHITLRVDLGKIDAKGYVHIVGRGKDLIITGGYNVYPKEVESEIDAMQGVVESAVIGLPHKDFGEGVTAVVVGRPGARLEPAAMLHALETRLARFKLPKRLIIVTELPRNSMGKVQKNILRETYRDLYC